jgi:hypothetical protein
MPAYRLCSPARRPSTGVPQPAAMCAAVIAGPTSAGASLEQALIAIWWGLLDAIWPTWIGNLANLMQLVSPVIALLAVLVTRRAQAGRLPPSRPSTIGSRPLPCAWLLEREMPLENAAKLVDVIIRLTGWTQVRLVHELRQSARSLQEPVPLGLDQVTINRWARGRQKPSPYYERLLRHVYTRVAGGTIDQQTAVSLGLTDTEEMENMKRRRFLHYLTVLATSMTVDSDRLGSALDARSRVDSSLLDSLESITTRYAKQWDAVEPLLLLPCVHHHVEALHELLLQSHPTAITRRLQGITAEAAALAGWEAWLTGDRTTAETYFTIARELAENSGHKRITSFVLVARSFLYSGLFGASEHVTNRPLRLLDEAVAIAARTSSPHLRSFALVRRAEELAATGGGGTAVREDVDAAEAALAGVRVADGGFFHYFDEERIAGTRGTCAALMGNTSEAISVLSHVIATTPPSLAAERSILITDLAGVYARMDEVEYACELLGRSLSLGYRGHVNRIDRIISVRRTLLHPRADVPVVRQLDEQLELYRTGAV